MQPQVDLNTFLSIGGTIGRQVFRAGVVEHMVDYRSHFGVSPSICLLLWNRCQRSVHMPSNARPKHLLWALLHLKVYGTESTAARMCGTTRKTYRGWVRQILKVIAGMSPQVVRVRAALFTSCFDWQCFCLQPCRSKFPADSLVQPISERSWQNLQGHS